MLVRVSLRQLRISPSVTRKIAENGLARARSKRGFREVQQPFAAAADLGVVFAAYGYACAFTGKSLKTEAEADPRGYLLVIGTDQLTSDPTLLIPASTNAIHAYERGHLALGSRYNFLVDLERVDPEFLEELNPIGRLRLPDSVELQPNLEQLGAHRAKFAAGEFDPY